MKIDHSGVIHAVAYQTLYSTLYYLRGTKNENGSYDFTEHIVESGCGAKVNITLQDNLTKVKPSLVYESSAPGKF